MRSFALLLCLAFVAPAFATNEENPCGNHGNNCCTEDGGESYQSVAVTCQSFCESTAVAVAVAVSEAAATCSAECSQTCGSQVAASVAACSTQIDAAVTNATANCAQTCSTPVCLKWRIRYRDGVPVARVCKRTAEQPL